MSTSTTSSRRMTRGFAKENDIIVEDVPAISAPTPRKAPGTAKKAVTTGKKKSVLADVTNAMDTSSTAEADIATKPSTTAIAINWDVDALVAEKQEDEIVPAVVAQVTPLQATEVVPAAPQLLAAAAAIDPSILALKKVRAVPIIPAFSASSSNWEDSDNEEIVPSSRRVQMVYDEEGELVAMKGAAPIVHASILIDAQEEDEEEREDLTLVGEVERMSSNEEFIAPAPLAVESRPFATSHAAPIASSSVGVTSYSTGYLPSGIVSASAVRSVKLDAFDQEAQLPAYLFAAPASTQANVEKVTGFVASGIDANRIASKKL